MHMTCCFKKIQKASVRYIVRHRLFERKDWTNIRNQEVMEKVFTSITLEDQVKMNEKVQVEENLVLTLQESIYNQRI